MPQGYKSGKQSSVMKHKFSEVPKAQIQRSSFDRTCGYKSTFDAGFLIPFFVDEALPGDTFNLRATVFARLATPLKPIMDNLFMDTFFFFVPNRLLWSNWQKFNGEQTDPGDSTDFTVPTIFTAPGEGSISDYMGLPTGLGAAIRFSALWHRGYNLIWNEWFRDQNLQDSVNVPLVDGTDSITNYTLLRRGKRHDYFTSCLPFPQKGDSVALPLGTSAPVTHDGVVGDDLGVFASVIPGIKRMDVGVSFVEASTSGGGTIAPLYADLTTATAATINELRQAFQIQRLLERDARGGTRYTEVIKAHFGVTSPDSRLQRPEYLGGGSSPVVISPIAQTAGEGTETSPTPQGNLAAIGTASFSGHGFSKSFTEHGVIIGLVSVRADLTYQQGMDRMWSRATRFDFFWPALAHLGEQAVLQQEIFADGVPANDDLVFGYQERFAEYRYKPSKITGEFRSNAATPLDIWHLSQDFAAAPLLDDTFIEENPPVDRIIAVPSEPHFLFDSYISLKCARPMPVYGVPGLIDHF